jgi:hypothetical protein
MSDAEHELIVDMVEAKADVEHFRELARRALVAASVAQDAASGRHDEWIDDALLETTPLVDSQVGDP